MVYSHLSGGLGGEVPPETMAALGLGTFVDVPNREASAGGAPRSALRSGAGSTPVEKEERELSLCAWQSPPCTCVNYVYGNIVVNR